ncbi:hypothetical protein [Planktothrix mougeotii]|uniref:Uncharacterized protein n=1 Tax=Planktothrix mougeotii LEGE 06226 TaxID=1828728 RepID=A0ABR9UD11_9CYAN|nr:hypothetical protein [Planktothrix mougeotii]MBE9144312.1 hypothetical protein [Planktothrix mougeotii LEGE 06226]
MKFSKFLTTLAVSTSLAIAEMAGFPNQTPKEAQAQSNRPDILLVNGNVDCCVWSPSNDGIWMDKLSNIPNVEFRKTVWDHLQASQPVVSRRVIIKSANGNYFLDHRIADRYVGLADQPYNPATGAYNGELWELVDAGKGRVIIKSANGNYFLDHRIADRYVGLADQPYNPATGAYNGELWILIPK